MAYVLVNIKDTSVTLDLSNWGWIALRGLLLGAGWEPKGATGHWDIMTDKPVDVPLTTETGRQNSYEGCCLQRVCADDVLAMLTAARCGMDLCDTNPEGTFQILKTLRGDARACENHDASEATTTVRSMLKAFADFAEHGEFFID
jgi:hypothetical protein